MESVDPFSIRLMGVLVELRAKLAKFHQPRKMLIHAVRDAVETLQASSGIVVTIQPDSPTAEVVYATPDGLDWNLGVLKEHIKKKHPRMPANILTADIKRRDRMWGVIALRFDHEATDGRLAKALRSIAEIASGAVEKYDDNRIRVLRRRIEQKVVGRQDPKDIIYLIMHGIRDLTKYNHSSSLFVADHPDEPLQLIAEQIAWTKAKSTRIGLKIPLEQRFIGEIDGGGVGLYQRKDQTWKNINCNCDSPLAEMLDSHNYGDADIPRENAMLCAVFRTPDEAIGILKVASRYPWALGGFEASLVERLLPLLSLSTQFLRRTWMLSQQVLMAERKHALANLSRGIAHDINNAMGSVLPLVQQIQEDARSSALSSENLLDDLQVIESGLQTCRRIFRGMLALARSGDRSIGNGNVRRAIDSAVVVIQDVFKRKAITLELDVPSELPAVQGNQGDITQVFLNLFTNSADAMPEGGRLSVRARAMGPMIEVEVEDTGCGIAEKFLPRVTEPFVTTKIAGNGLGLSICRSIMWETGGEMNITSVHGSGTKVLLRFPVEAALTREA